MTPAGGLRERKKRATLDAIRSHALDLSLKVGYDAVTVDAICAAAGISQRTFFNYVGTKENAVLGAEPPQPTPEQRAAYRSGLGGTPLEDLVHTIAATMTAASPSAVGLLRKRFAVTQNDPALRRASAARLEHIRESLAELVAERLAADRRRRGGGTDAAPDDVAEEADMTVLVALAVFRHLGRQWAQAGPADASQMAQAIDRGLRLLTTVAAGREPAG